MTEQAEFLVLACGALARELTALSLANESLGMVVECLPASLHNTPARIPEELARRINQRKRGYKRILIGYGDCGTAGGIDALCSDGADGQPVIERLPGAHCYEFYAGHNVFAVLQDREPGTFYLTDYLVRHFDRLVMTGLGLDRHPELRDAYFGNYTRVLYLSQTPAGEDSDLLAGARRAAETLGLRLEYQHCGLGQLEPSVVHFAKRTRAA